MRVITKERRSITCQQGNHGPCKRTPAYGNPQCTCLCHDRAALAAEVYQAFLNNTESFEADNVGMTLAYLLGAILTGGKFEHSVEVPANHRVSAREDAVQTLRLLERAISDVCDDDTQNAISDRYCELMGETGYAGGSDLYAAGLEVLETCFPGRTHPVWSFVKEVKL